MPPRLRFGMVKLRDALGKSEATMRYHFERGALPQNAVELRLVHEVISWTRALDYATNFPKTGGVPPEMAGRLRQAIQANRVQLEKVRAVRDEKLKRLNEAWLIDLAVEMCEAFKDYTRETRVVCIIPYWPRELSLPGAPDANGNPVVVELPTPSAPLDFAPEGYEQPWEFDVRACEPFDITQTILGVMEKRRHAAWRGGVD